MQEGQEEGQVRVPTRLLANPFIQKGVQKGAIVPVSRISDIPRDIIQRNRVDANNPPQAFVDEQTGQAWLIEEHVGNFRETPVYVHELGGHLEGLKEKGQSYYDGFQTANAILQAIGIAKAAPSFQGVIDKLGKRVGKELQGVNPEELNRLIQQRAAVKSEDTALWKKIEADESKLNPFQKAYVTAAGNALALGQSRQIVPEETFAYLSEQNLDFGPFKRIAAQVKVFLHRLGLDVNFDEKDYALLALNAAHAYVRNFKPTTKTPTPELRPALASRGQEARYARAFHGTPYTFEPEKNAPLGKFTTKKIGIGEGNQAFGHGLYFTDKIDIAEHYKKIIVRYTYGDGKHFDKKDITKLIDVGIFDEDLKPANNWKQIANRKLNEANRVINDEDSTNFNKSAAKETIELIQPVLDKGIIKGEGRVYEVDLKPADDEWLLWDERLSNQSEKVKKILSNNRIVVNEETTVRMLYDELDYRKGSPEAASRFLASIGIPGIKFLAGDSRRKGEGNYNYVVFQDKDIEILNRYSYAGPQARTADQPKLLDAKMRLDSGQPMKTIRKETGWFMGDDGKWRFEISDRYSAWKVRHGEDATEMLVFRVGTKPTKLGEVFDHPKLFAAYPYLQDVTFVRWLTGGSNGEFDPVTNTIRINPKLNSNEAKSTLTHEIQHWIQHLEGFAFGGTPGIIPLYNRSSLRYLKKILTNKISSTRDTVESDYLKENLEIVKKLEPVSSRLEKLFNRGKSIEREQNVLLDLENIEKKALSKKLKDRNADLEMEYALIKEEIKNIDNKINNLISAKYQLNESERGEIDAKIASLQQVQNSLETQRNNILDSIHKKTPEDRYLLKSISSRLDRIDNVVKRHNASIANTINKALGKPENYKFFGSDNEATLQWLLYRTISGEIEARDVQNRLDLTEQDRQDNPPYLATQVVDGIPNDSMIDVKAFNLRYSRAAQASQPKELTADQRFQYAAAALGLMASNKDLFAYPKSDKTTVKDIAAELDPALTVMPYQEGMKLPEWITSQNFSELYAVKMPDGRYGYLYAGQKGKKATNEVYINASELKEGKSQGTLLYQLAGQWAANNGKVFIGDPTGISVAGKIRRIENLISLALKYGTTDYILPHPNQKVPWKVGDHGYNLAQLLKKSSETIYQALPQLKEIAYDFEKNQFVKKAVLDGNRPVEPGSEQILGPDYFRVLAESEGARKAEAGRRTLERAVFVNSLLQGAGTDGWKRILEKLAGFGTPGGLAERLKGTFYSRATPNPDLEEFRRKTGRGPELSWAQKLTGFLGSPQAIKEKSKAISEEAMAGALDRRRPIEALRLSMGLTKAESGLYHIRLAEGIPGTFKHFLEYGEGIFDPVSGIIKQKNNNSLISILRSLDGQEGMDTLWDLRIARRAERLKNEPLRDINGNPKTDAQGNIITKERNLNWNEIDAAKAHLDEIRRTNPELWSKVEEADRKLTSWFDSLLQLMEDSGLLKKGYTDNEGVYYPGDAEIMRRYGDYIPFYRMVDEKVVSPKAGRGFSHQRGPRALLGGKDVLNSPLSNILLNAGASISSSVRNVALERVIRALVNANSPIIEKLGRSFETGIMPADEIRRILQNDQPGNKTAENFKAWAQALGFEPGDLSGMEWEGFQKVWLLSQPAGDGVVRVMKDGKPEFYKIKDPDYFKALTDFESNQFGLPLEIVRYFKRLLTWGVTKVPAFWIHNSIRDFIQAATIYPELFPLKQLPMDIAKAVRMTVLDPIAKRIPLLPNSWKQAIEKADKLNMDLGFAGATFEFGYLNAGDPGQMERAAKAALRLVSPVKLGQPYTWLNMGPQVLAKIDSLGNRFENVTRRIIAEKILNATGSTLIAAGEARDVMDFAIQGNWRGMQMLIATIPFFNARMQGMYKLGREGAIPVTPKALASKIAFRGMTLALASLLLYAINRDDPRWKQLRDDQKDNFWHIFFPVEWLQSLGYSKNEALELSHIVIPKPFEIGLLYGTLLGERLPALVMGDENAKKFLNRVQFGVVNTLAVGWPQIGKPVLELIANKSFYTGAPIEDFGDVGLLPSQRYNERTSITLRQLGQFISDETNLSPKQLEHLWNGYLGSMGMLSLYFADALTNRALGRTVPTSFIGEDPFSRTLSMRSGIPYSTQQMTDLYNLRAELDKVHKSILDLRREGGYEAARALQTERREQLRVRPYVKAQTDRLNAIKRAMEQVIRNDKLTPQQKKDRIIELRLRRAAIATQAIGSLKARNYPL